MSTIETSGAVAALDAVISQLAAAGITGVVDAGAFYPQPVGVLVGLPALTSRGLSSATYAVRVLVVSGDPLNELTYVHRLLALADDVAYALRIDNYRSSGWAGNVNSEPLPALEMTATVTLTDGGSGYAAH